MAVRGGVGDLTRKAIRLFADVEQRRRHQPLHFVVGQEGFSRDMEFVHRGQKTVSQFDYAAQAVRIGSNSVTASRKTESRNGPGSSSDTS